MHRLLAGQAAALLVLHLFSGKGELVVINMGECWVQRRRKKSVPVVPFLPLRVASDPLLIAVGTTRNACSASRRQTLLASGGARQTTDCCCCSLFLFSEHLSPISFGLKVTLLLFEKFGELAHFRGKGGDCSITGRRLLRSVTYTVWAVCGQ